MHKGRKCIQIIWDHLKKNSFLLKTTKNARYVRSLGKNLILGHTQSLKQVLRVVRCAKNTAHGPKKMEIPRGIRKKCFLCRKSAILSVTWKFYG